MRGTAVDIAPGKGKAPADGKLVGRSRRTAQNDLGGQDITGKPRQGGDLDPDEFAERAADLQVMRYDMERYGFHRAAKLPTGCTCD
jgi:hypothetical protein